MSAVGGGVVAAAGVAVTVVGVVFGFGAAGFAGAGAVLCVAADACRWTLAVDRADCPPLPIVPAIATAAAAPAISAASAGIRPPDAAGRCVRDRRVRRRPRRRPAPCGRLRGFAGAARPRAPAVVAGAAAAAAAAAVALAGRAAAANRWGLVAASVSAVSSAWAKSCAIGQRSSGRLAMPRARTASTDRRKRAVALAGGRRLLLDVLARLRGEVLGGERPLADQRLERATASEYRSLASVAGSPIARSGAR